MKRIAPLLALLAAAVLGGCARAGGGDDVVQLEFWGMGREGEVVAQLIPEFERRNPNIRVTVQQIPWTAAHEKLLTAFVGEATPDVAQLGNTWIPEFAALHAIAPLGRRVARSSDIRRTAFFPGIWATNELRDTLYGVPWYVDTRVIFYRADLLRAAGFDSVPSTWAGFHAALVALRKRMGPHAYPLLLPVDEWPPSVILAMQAGSPLLRDGGRFGAFEGDSFRRGFRYYLDLYRDGLAQPVATSQVANLYQEFARGNVAMYITGPWNLGEFTDRLPPEVQGEWMTAPLPGPDGPGLSLAGGSSLVLFRGSRHPKAAWKLIEYLSEPEQQVAFYQLSGDLPALRAAWDDTVLANNRRARAFREQLERVVPTPKVPEWEQIATRIYQASEAVVMGGTTVDRALSELDHDVDRMLEKRRWMIARRSGAYAKRP